VLEKPAFIQGIFAFQGAGLEFPVSFPSPATYAVPSDKRSQTIYFRAGNPSPEMIYLVLTRSGKPMRYFPVGAKGSVHVPLAVLEDLAPGSAIEVLVGAPPGMNSWVVLDVGFMEIA
jgi:hypothetical protein